MGLAERLFDPLWRISPGEKKPQITCAVRPGSNRVVQPRGNRKIGDPVNRAGPPLSGSGFQNSTLWNGNHHDAGGILFARWIPSPEFQRMTQEPLSQSDSHPLLV